MTVGGGGPQFASQRIAEALQPHFELHYVCAPDAQHSLNDSFRQNLHLVPALTRQNEPSRVRTAALMFITVYRALKIVDQVRPRAIIGIQQSTGFPLMLAGTLYGAKRVQVETITRTKKMSLTARLLLKLRLVDRVYVQWPSMLNGDRRVVYKGTVL